MAGQAKELSTKWWNVKRREMRATTATEHEHVPCSDCGSPTHLMEGRFGRFYKCWRFDCQGTVGARLDGTPRTPKGPPALLEARARARDAVQLVVLERDHYEQLKIATMKAKGLAWWNCEHHLSNCKVEFDDIERVAKLDRIVTHRDRRSYWKRGLFIRRRSLEECERIVEAAGILREGVQERIRDEERRQRNNAWDKVMLGEAIGEEPPPQIENRSLERASWEMFEL